VPRKHSSDAHVDRVQKYDTQADNHGRWETWSLAQPAVDENILKRVFAKELLGGVPESASESVRSGGTSCANFGVDHKSARVPGVEQMTLVAELVVGNPDAQVHTLGVQISGCGPQESKVGQKSNRRLVRVVQRDWSRL
jgi:hypothetical protein